jgi:hypothetical protein
MHRQDYQRVANALTEAYRLIDAEVRESTLPIRDVARGGVTIAAQCIANALASDNPRFDPVRFFGAVHQVKVPRVMRKGVVQ